MDALSMLLPIQGLSELAQEDGSHISPEDPNMMILPFKRPYQDLPVKQDGSGMDAGLAVAGMSAVALAVIAVSVGSIVLSAYHGYKRNGNDLAWGALWGAMGAAFGPIPLGIAWAQGFGKRAR